MRDLVIKTLVGSVVLAGAEGRWAVTDGKENVRRGRYHGDLRSLVRGPLEERCGRVAGVDRKTVRKYLAPAESAGLVPGGPPMTEADWAKLIKGWFPQLVNSRLRQLRWADIDPHRDYVEGCSRTG